jgi:hypothetical protein
MARRTYGKPSRTAAARRTLPPLPVRRTAVFLAAVVATMLVPATASAATRSLPLPSFSKLSTAGTIRDADVFSLRGAVQQLPGFWGGVQTTSAGEMVSVFASDTYTQDPARTLAWAEYLTKLDHAAEIGTLQLYVAPLDEVQRVCGNQALACYSAQQGMILAPGDAPDPETSAEAIVAHEYGHHVAANRDNAPWEAVDWGTKRWATYMNVCSRTRQGVFYPGNESGYYKRNPGEGFAESYRVLNEQRLGMTPTAWGVVDQLLYPDAQALALVQQDVEQPWTTPTTSTITGRVTAKAPRSTRTIAIPLDGTVRVSLRPPANSRMTLGLADSAGRVLAATTKSAPYTANVSTTACGQRSLVARVTAVKGAGAYRLTVTRP